MSAIHLRFASVERTDFGCVTRFDDGSFVNSTFHPQDPHYHVIAHRTGYEDDLHAYCLEHELVHCLLSERLHSRASPVLWALAHGTELSGAEAAFEGNSRAGVSAISPRGRAADHRRHRLGCA